MNLMDFLIIKIGPFEIRGELLILIGLMMWIIFASVCFSCIKIRFGIEEGFEMIKNVVQYGADPTKVDPVLYNPATPLMSKDIHVYPRTPVSPADNLAVSSMTGGDLLPARGDIGGSEFKSPVGYKTYQIPADKMDIMSVTSFKPECCPSVYSTSTGCACITSEQNTFFAERGGNNYPIAEY
jgi:hypothetical protein